jgi:mono/diheme cytochrome c family protein
MRYGCFQCHGTVGQGAATRFGPKIAPDPIPFAAFERQLRNPRNPIQTYTPMPVYTRKIMTDQQVADIYAYLKTIPPAKKAADIPLLNLK